jgi:hypothetical protein
MTSFWVPSHKIKKLPPECITWHMKGRSGSATVYNEEELHQVLWDHGCNIVTDDDHEMRDWFVHVVADHNSPHVSVMIKLSCSNCTWCHISVWADAFNSCLILFLCQASVYIQMSAEKMQEHGTWIQRANSTQELIQICSGMTTRLNIKYGEIPTLCMDLRHSSPGHSWVQ